MGRAEMNEMYDDGTVKTEAFPPIQEQSEGFVLQFPPPPQQSVGEGFVVHQFPPPPPPPTQHSAYPQQQIVSEGIVHQFPPPPQQGSYPQQIPGGAAYGGGGVQMGKPMPYFNNNNFQGTPMQNPPATQQWSSELFDCMNDPQNALITACFPCVTFGQIAEIVDSGATTCGTSGMMYGAIALCIAMPCLISCGYRTKLRSKFGLMEIPGPDWAVHCFCEWCALCQEYRELQARGFDPAIGWMGNVAKQQQQQMGMAPPMHQRMM